MGFRVKRGVNVPADMQGYIYYHGQIYARLPRKERERVRELCERIGGDNEKALFEFITTDHRAEQVCREHYIGSKETLYSLVRKYYEEFAAEL